MTVRFKALAVAVLAVFLSGVRDASALSSDPDPPEVQAQMPDLCPLARFGTATVVAASPDGRHIVTQDDDGHLSLWDTTVSEPVEAPLAGRHCLSALAFSPDGTRLVASEGDALLILDAATGSPLAAPFGEAATALAYSPDGTRILGAVSNGIRVWDAATGNPVGPALAGETADMAFVTFSSDGRLVAGASDNIVRIWDVVTGQSVGVPLVGHTDRVNAVAFSPDGRRIVSGSDDATLRIWDVATGKLVLPPIENRYPYRQDAERTVLSGLLSVAFSPDGRRIASGSQDRTIRIWDAVTGDQIGQPLVGHSSDVDYIAFASDGRTLLSASMNHMLSGDVRVWNTDSVLRPPNGLTEGESWARCLLVVYGETRISGRCAYSRWDETGGFSINGPQQLVEGIDYPVPEGGAETRSNDYWAVVYRDDDGWHGYSNSDIHATHGDETYEKLWKIGACFVGRHVRLCVWR
jgi:WD40 repeat protein